MVGYDLTVQHDVAYPDGAMTKAKNDSAGGASVINGDKKRLQDNIGNMNSEQKHTNKTKDLPARKRCIQRNVFPLDGSVTDRILKWNSSKNFDPESIEWFVGKLKPQNHPVVPNIAHFTWLNCPEFKFYNLISILSIYRTMNPDRMMFHTDCNPEPKGPWWDEAKRIPVLEIVHHKRPKTIFGIPIINLLHQTDVLRLQSLLQYGGVYFDLDFWLFRPFEQLRYYDYVANRPGSGRLCNGVILANKNSKYLRLFYESYRNFEPKCLACTSIINANKLAFEHRDLLHIELYSFYRNIDHCQDWQMEYFSPMDWELPRYSIHFFHRLTESNGQPFPDPQNIKTMNNTIGEIARYIYYGTKDIITDE
ncbi:uncharacterized protein LOC144341661 [Saccoglossus kowalevskii]